MEGDGEELVAVGFFMSDVVRSRHFTGQIDGLETVELVRDPGNPHNNKAIKVISRFLDVIGYLSRSATDTITKLIDSGIVVVEGYIPRSESVVYKPPEGESYPFLFPIEIHVFTYPDSVLDIRDRISTRVHLIAPPVPVREMVCFLQLELVKHKSFTGTINAGDKFTFECCPWNQNILEAFNSNSTRVGIIGRDPSRLLIRLIKDHCIAIEGFVSKPPTELYFIPCEIRMSAFPDNLLDLHESESDLWKLKPVFIPELLDSSIFGAMTKPPLEPPLDMIFPNLFAHQKQALGWLVERETSEDLPPFWEEQDGIYINLLTNQRTYQQPPPLRGGIFADDMGMGKSLTLISLIAITKSNIGILGHSITLIVCPEWMIQEWIRQLEEYIQGNSLRFYSYHGEHIDESALAGYDIVLTTYHSQLTPLHSIEFFRILLDDAHVMKGFEAVQLNAIIALKSKRRWAVTGRPIEDFPIDLFYLISFLLFQPFCIKHYWHCLVQRPFYQQSNIGLFRLRTFIQAISLRRIKDAYSGSSSLHLLPPKLVETIFLELSTQERAKYDRLELLVGNIVKKYIDNHTLLQEHSVSLQMIGWLRQLCNGLTLCHSDIRSSLQLVTPPEESSHNQELITEFISMVEDEMDCICSVCYDRSDRIETTLCGHGFCSDCLYGLLEKEDSSCPTCHITISSMCIISSEPRVSSMSSKVSCLLRLLESKPHAKCVIFSEFKTLLKILEGKLKKSNMRVLLLNEASMSKKIGLMEEFSSGNCDVMTVLLASFDDACLGMKMISASMVFLMEPVLNPLVEKLAVDKVHMIGQLEAVRVVRFIVNDTIESRIVDLQESKMKAMQGIVKSKSSNRKGQSLVEELRTLLHL